MAAAFKLDIKSMYMCTWISRLQVNSMHVFT